MISRKITQQIITDLSYFPAVGIIGLRQVILVTGLLHFLKEILTGFN
jgi:hypothetical protein